MPLTASTLSLLRSQRCCLLAWQKASALASFVQSPAASPGGQEEPVPEDKAFVDKRRLLARGGDGGSGAFSNQKGRGRVSEADGGNGGAGGDVVVLASASKRSLHGINYLQRAGAGTRGRKQRMNGARGEDVVIAVPLGVVVSVRPVPKPPEQDDFDQEEDFAEGAAGSSAGSGGLQGGFSEESGKDEGEPSAEEVPGRVVADLVAEGERVVVAQGGLGGKGNASFPRRLREINEEEALAGKEGEEVEVYLELKALADVGLVGFPSTGKSSLLTAISNARPKVAAYPFTTRHTQLGTLSDPAAIPGVDALVIADVPGLISGAHANRGLGHAFLRHIERCRKLAFVVDLTSGADVALERPSPQGQLAVLQEELRLYQARLLEVPACVVATKLDCLTEEAAAEAVVDLRAATHLPVLPISSHTGQGLLELQQCWQRCTLPPSQGRLSSAICLGHCKRRL